MLKIESVPVIETDPRHSSLGDSQVVVLRVSGHVDDSSAVVRRARELIGRTGSQAMADSFDWAVEQQVLASSD